MSEASPSPEREPESMRERILKAIANQPDEPDDPEARRRAEQRALAHFQDDSEEVLLYLSGDKRSYVDKVLAAGRGGGFRDAQAREYQFRVSDDDIRALESLQHDALQLSLSDPGDDRIRLVGELNRRAWQILAAISVPNAEPWRGDSAPDMHTVIGELAWQMTPKLFAIAYAQRYTLPRK